MQEIDLQNATAYLRQVGQLAGDESCEVAELAGGVSNLVLRVSFPDGHRSDFVLKQARPQLRTADPWFCTVERIWREVDVLKACAELLADFSAATPSLLHAVTPAVLFEDRDNYVFTMSAAPAAHTVWKAELLAGRVEPWSARQCGLLLGALHAGSWKSTDLAVRLADRQVFRELRLDPYFRHVARVHPAEARHFQRLIDGNEGCQLSLVHADFSPKNLLVYPIAEAKQLSGMMLVDFETGHFGDPAFDLGFFLSHLVLKAFHFKPHHQPYLDLTREFWTAYESVLRPAIGDVAYRDLLARGIQNLAGCAWARIDGTSKVDYLQDTACQSSVRVFCRELFRAEPSDWSVVLAMAGS
ncbi:MAG: phosphotransferase family protein [Pirellulales bacterium]